MVHSKLSQLRRLTTGCGDKSQAAGGDAANRASCFPPCFWMSRQLHKHQARTYLRLLPQSMHADFITFHTSPCTPFCLTKFSTPSAPQVAHDVDGSGNYLLLTHRHVAHLHPFSSYLCRQPCPSPPSWVLYHEFTISRDNCILIASEVHPQM